MRLKQQTVSMEVLAEGVLWSMERDLEDFDEKTAGLKGFNKEK